MLDLIKQKNYAQRNGCWLESISLSYILLEIELRLLLSSKAGALKIPIPPRTIDNQEYLMKLAKLSKAKGFINEDILKRIREFNKVRRRVIHGLAQGKISYSDLRETAFNCSQVVYDIQSCWLPIKFGQEETRPDD